MNKIDNFVKCDLCGKEFQYGPQIYEGRLIPSWKMYFCKTCYGGNHDGIVLNQHLEFKKKLEDRDIKYKLNNNGWLNLP